MFSICFSTILKKKYQSKLNIKGMLPLYYNASRKDYGVLFPLVFPRVFFYFVAALILVSRSGYFVFFGWRAFSCCLPLSYNAWRCGHELRQQSQSTVYRDFVCFSVPVVFLRCSSVLPTQVVFSGFAVIWFHHRDFDIMCKCYQGTDFSRIKTQMCIRKVCDGPGHQGWLHELRQHSQEPWCLNNPNLQQDTHEKN
jgi:hypothetical protein